MPATTTTPSEKPASVKLTAFASFRVPSNKPDADLDIVYGASRGKILGQGPEARRILEMGNVPIGAGFKAPEGGLLMLYGFRDNIEELRQRRVVARESKAEFHYAEVEVQVDTIVVGLVDKAALKGLKFVNVRRMTAGLQSHVLAEFSKYVQEEGGSEDEEMSKVQQIAQRPDLWGRLLENDANFKSIDVVVIPLADDSNAPNRVRQLAFVRHGANVIGVDQNTEINQFVLPEWFKAPRKAGHAASPKTSAPTAVAPGRAKAPVVSAGGKLAAGTISKAAVKKAPSNGVKSASKKPVKAKAGATATA